MNRSRKVICLPSFTTDLLRECLKVILSVHNYGELTPFSIGGGGFLSPQKWDKNCVCKICTSFLLYPIGL